MKISPELSDSAITAELGSRLARARLDLNLTQAHVADAAGVGRATIERIEAGEIARTSSLIRVLRVLGLIGGLDRLVPEPGPTPIELLELRGRQRRRAAPSKSRLPEDAPAVEPWVWGDERSGDQ